MKKIIITITNLLIITSIFAQSPEKMSYQAVVRNSSNGLVTNQKIGMEINIRQGSQTGTVVYTETQTPNTNANGLVSIEIGGGAGFSTINWANGPYYIETRTDPTGTTNYTITGTSQLLSVPFALYAKNATNAATTAYVDALLKRIENLELVNEGFIDSRDGNHYDVVKIGNQVWMAENLKYLPSVVYPLTGSPTTPYYYVYGYEGTNVADAKATANYATYGVLYNWPAVMAGAASSNANPSGVQGVCPTGWHLPSVAEWIELTNYLGDPSVAGGKLKETGTTHWSGPNTGAINESGFTALPGGYRSFDGNGSFGSLNTFGYWWNSTELNASLAWYLYMSSDNSFVLSTNLNKELGFSVRCVRD